MVIAPVNKDYGLDLRIEVTRGEYVTGEEFAVQINGQASVRVKGDLPPLANVRQATVNYWLGKLTPTMIAAGKPRLIPGRIAARSGSKPDRS